VPIGTQERAKLHLMGYRVAEVSLCCR
jgi:hypothetical protein